MATPPARAPGRLEGRVAVVTGGARGIGAAVAGRLSAAGAAVAALDLEPAAPGGSPVRQVACDVADETALEAAFDEVTAWAGAVPDLVVLNAGVGGFAPLLRLSTEEWDRVMAVNTRAVFLGLRGAARRLVDAGRPGSVVVVSSVSGTTNEVGMAHYGASKAAVNHLVRTAARELGPHGIRVNAVAPGTTDTPLFASTAALPGFAERVAARTPLGGVGEPGAVAAVVAALLGLEWVTGQVLAADGGLSLYSPIDPLEGRR